MRFEEIEDTFEKQGETLTRVQSRILDLEEQRRRDSRTMVFLLVGMVLIGCAVYIMLRETRGEAAE